MKLQLILALTLIAFVNAQRESYLGYKVYEIQPKNNEQIKVLASLRDAMDFWKFSRDTDEKAVVMVTPIQEILLKAVLEAHGIGNAILIEDVEKTLQIERQKQAVATRRANGGISFDAYHRHAVINNYLDDLAKKYPQLVKVEDVGKSYEGRIIKMIKISSGGNGTKPVIFMDACIHAREWLTPAFALYVINQLVEDNSKNDVMLKNADWYLIPVINPDGYEFSHTTVGRIFPDNRLWRKTRSLTSNAKCIGVDGNRNFDEHWSVSGGASTKPCNDDYRGERSASEPEVILLSNLLQIYKNAIKMYISLHTYGNWLLTPYGYTTDLPEGFEDILGLGKNVSDAITAATGSKYKVGSTANLLYTATGVSNDYAYGSAGIKFSYTWELPGGGKDGFDFPPEQLESALEETFVGMQVFSKYVSQHF